VRAATVTTVTGYFFNVSNDTSELPGSWSNAHGAARPAIYRSLVNRARHGSGSKPEPMRNIEIAVENCRSPVEQVGDRRRCFDIGDIAMQFLYAPTHSRLEAPGGRLLQMQSMCAVDRNTRRRFAEKGVGFPSPILSTAMIISPNAVRLELSPAPSVRVSTSSFRLNNVH
jgi:hypothetical protein